MYCDDGVLPALMRLISSCVIRVFTEISTGVQTIFFQGARSTMCAASGSNQMLNSCRGVLMNSGSVVCGFKLAPMKTSSFASCGNSGSMEMASARSVSYTHLRAHETPEHLVCRL